MLHMQVRSSSPNFFYLFFFVKNVAHAYIHTAPTTCIQSHLLGQISLAIFFSHTFTHSPTSLLLREQESSADNLFTFFFLKARTTCYRSTFLGAFSNGAVTDGVCELR